MEEVMFYLSDLIDKIKGIVFNFLSAVPGETLVTLILAAIVAIYFMKASKDRVKRAIESKKHKTEQRLCMEELEMQLQFFFGFMTGGNKPAFLQACKTYMQKNNYKLSHSTVKQMIHDNMWVWKNNEKQKKGYLADDKADKMIDAVYKFMQLGFERGPEYEKLQKKIKAKLKHSMKDIDINSAEFEAAKDSIVKDCAFDSDIHNQQVMDDMNRHMQDHMMHDMNMQMQQQMMNDMQMQMQMQMMNDMQMQMQMQMMNDMQMQMQMQMMHDMQMQMQQQMMNDMQMQMQNQMMNDMNQQMLNSMNDANMAMTSTDFGGHMNSDMNSGNFGMF